MLEIHSSGPGSGPRGRAVGRRAVLKAGVLGLTGLTLASQKQLLAAGAAKTTARASS